VTSAVRFLFFITISILLHLLCLSFSFHIPLTVSRPQSASFEYTSASRDQFLPEKKKRPIIVPQKQLAPSKKTSFAQVKSQSSIEKKQILPSQVVHKPRPVKKTVPVNASAVAVEVSPSRELPSTSNISSQNKTVVKSSSNHDEPASATLGETQQSTQGSPNVVMRSKSVESLGGTQVFTAALPRYDQNPKPVYPEVARRRGWEGTVEFEVVVLKDGRVGNIKMVKSSGHRSLDRAARKSIRRWLFKAASLSGTNIESRVVVPIDFSLSQ